MAKDFIDARNVNEALIRSDHGDRAGEYMQMERGRYDAWIYVVIAFLMQVAAVGGITGGIASLIPSDRDTSHLVLLIVGGLTGGAAAWFTFRDRWRCIEAFSSQFCSGVANLSLLYVPLVAFVYANVRGLRKLSGR